MRCMEPLLAELSSDSVGRLDIEAADAIADPRLHPALLKLKSWWSGDDPLDMKLLETALLSCGPKDR